MKGLQIHVIQQRAQHGSRLQGSSLITADDVRQAAFASVTSHIEASSTSGARVCVYYIIYIYVYIYICIYVNVYVNVYVYVHVHEYAYVYVLVALTTAGLVHALTTCENCTWDLQKFFETNGAGVSMRPNTQPRTLWDEEDINWFASCVSLIQMQKQGRADGTPTSIESAGVTSPYSDSGVTTADQRRQQQVHSQVAYYHAGSVA